MAKTIAMDTCTGWFCLPSELSTSYPLKSSGDKTSVPATTAATTADVAEEVFIPPKVTRKIKCGLRNEYPMQHGAGSSMGSKPQVLKTIKNAHFCCALGASARGG